MVFSHVMRGRPGGLFQFSGEGAVWQPTNIWRRWGMRFTECPQVCRFFWRKTTPEYVTVWLCSCETVAGVTASSGIVNSTDTWWLGELCEYVSCCHGELTRRRRPATSPADLPVDVHCLHAGD